MQTQINSNGLEKFVSALKNCQFKRLVFDLTLAGSLITLPGCAWHMTYEPSPTKIDPIPAKVETRVEIENTNLSVFHELNTDLTRAISRDLQQSGFPLVNSTPPDMVATFRFHELRHRNQPWGLLYFPLVYLGAPIARSIADIDVSLTLTDANQRIIGTYTTDREMRKWRGLYYNLAIADVSSRKYIVRQAMTLAMDDLKTSIAADRTHVVQSLKAGSPELASQFGSDKLRAQAALQSLPGTTLAVLPFANHTTDLDAGELARLLFALGLEEKGYRILDNATVDNILWNLGITDGGQLGSIAESELAKALQVDGMVYGTVLEAAYSTKAVAAMKKATVEIRIVKSGKVLFNRQESATQGTLGTSPNLMKSFASQIVDKTSQKAFAKYHGHPLELEIESTVYKLQNQLPGIRVEKPSWTTRSGQSMIGSTVIPTFQGPGLGFRTWQGKSMGFGLDVQPSWDFSDLLIQGRSMLALSTAGNKRVYGLLSFGVMKVHDQTSFSIMGISEEIDYRVTVPTVVLGVGLEKLYGIRKNHGLSFEAGVQVGQANYEYDIVIHDIPYYGDYTDHVKDTYKVFPLYLGASYCWYFKKALK